MAVKNTSIFLATIKRENLLQLAAKSKRVFNQYTHTHTHLDKI